ncbi:MAG: serine hydrolase [Cyclobacteriaceae bacterium]
MRSYTSKVTGWVLILIVFPFLSYSQKSPLYDSIISMIDSVVVAGIQNKAYPGAVLYVSQKDSVLVHRAYGTHRYDSSRYNHTDDIFDLASVTKVTAATLSLMKLYDNGLIDLDKSINEYVPGLGRSKFGQASIRSTLAHQAGLRAWIPYWQDMKTDKGWKKRFFSDSPSEKHQIKITDSLYLTNKNYQYIKRQIRKTKVNPEQGYVYSGLFFYLIPELVESLTGQDFETFLNQEFYQPLGASTTGFNPLERFDQNQIVPTEVDTFFRMEPIHGTVHDEGAILMGGISGNAGLFSNAKDLAKVWSMFLQDGKVDTIQYLSPQTLDLFTTAQFLGNRRGLGFDKPLVNYDKDKSSVAKAAGFRSYGHSGYTGPLVWADPDTDLLFIFLCNRVYPSRNQRMIYELGIRPQLHELVYQLIR